MLQKFIALITKPLPAWATIGLFMVFSPILAAATTLAYFATGTAAFGPGGMIDFGSVNASGTALNGAANPQMFAGSGGNNLSTQVPPGGILNFLNCLTAACSGANLQTTAQISSTSAVYNVPLSGAFTSAGSITAAPSAGSPVGPCIYANGTFVPCASTFHTIMPSSTTNNIVLSGACASALGTNCAVTTASSVVAFANNNGFNGNFACAASTNQTGFVIQTFNQNQGTMSMEVFNNTGATASGGTLVPVMWECTGY
jgi:hypothetical protein